MWIVRDKNGYLGLFNSKPELYVDFYYNGEPFFYIDKTLFPEITFENSPVEVELKIKYLKTNKSM